MPKYGANLSMHAGRPHPDPARMTVLQADIREIVSTGLAPADLVLSNSVYEHLDDVDGVTRALAALTRPDGRHIHFVDLRDHFFKYPFEMLCYSERVWRGWLNPSSNHNRFRLRDYRRTFEQFFARVGIEALGREEIAFEKARPRIRPEFLSGESREDSVTLICLTASGPRGT
jgi:SAM-dependent methyltransferase